jgi:hypothetical protein
MKEQSLLLAETLRVAARVPVAVSGVDGDSLAAVAPPPPLPPVSGEGQPALSAAAVAPPLPLLAAVAPPPPLPPVSGEGQPALSAAAVAPSLPLLVASTSFLVALHAAPEYNPRSRETEEGTKNSRNRVHELFLCFNNNREPTRNLIRKVLTWLTEMGSVADVKAALESYQGNKKRATASTEGNETRRRRGAAANPTPGEEGVQPQTRALPQGAEANPTPGEDGVQQQTQTRALPQPSARRRSVSSQPSARRRSVSSTTDATSVAAAAAAASSLLVKATGLTKELCSKFTFFKNYIAKSEFFENMTNAMNRIYCASTMAAANNGAEKGTFVIARTPHSALRCSGSLIDSLSSMKLSLRFREGCSQTCLTDLFADDPVYAVVRLLAYGFMLMLLEYIF